MNLHYHPMSGCSQRVVAYVAAHGIDLEHHVVALPEGAHKRPAFLAMNPNGKVPVLQDGDLVVWESAAILEYLAAKVAPAELGASPRERAAVTQWSYWGSGQLGNALSALNAEAGLKPMFGGTPDPELVAKLTDEVHRQLAVLDAQLARSGGHVAGPNRTVADFVIAPNLKASMQLSKLVLPELPHLQAWFDRMTTLDQG